jgi:hypothetical protein
MSVRQDPSDDNTYTLGRIGVHNVELACLPAGVAGTISSFKWLRFGLMVGIEGGVPSEENDIWLGDVVVGKPTGTFGGVIQYEFGKTVQEGRFERTCSLNKPPDVILTALANLQAKNWMESHEVAKHLLEMETRYPRMETKFAKPGTQHDLLYDGEYGHATKHATRSKCDPGTLLDWGTRHSEDSVIHYGLTASGDQAMRH